MFDQHVHARNHAEAIRHGQKVERLKRAHKGTWDHAVAIQRAERTRDGFRRAIPPPRLVAAD